MGGLCSCPQWDDFEPPDEASDGTELLGRRQAAYRRFFHRNCLCFCLCFQWLFEVRELGGRLEMEVVHLQGMYPRANGFQLNYQNIHTEELKLNYVVV